MQQSDTASVLTTLRKGVLGKASPLLPSPRGAPKTCDSSQGDYGKPTVHPYRFAGQQTKTAVPQVSESTQKGDAPGGKASPHKSSELPGILCAERQRMFFSPTVTQSCYILENG